MSKRRELETRLHSLTEIKDIMNAMKNLSLMEVHRLTHFLETQRRAVATIEAAARDFFSFYPELFPASEPFRSVYLVIGSERGFCGDFNEALLRALDERLGQRADVSLVAVGSKLSAKLADDSRVTALLDGPSVVEEVDPVLIKLMQVLTPLVPPQSAHLPVKLTVFHHQAGEEGVNISDLGSFQEPTLIARRAPYAPRLYLDPRTFLTALAEQYLFAALHVILYGSLLAENQRRMEHMEAAVRRLERTSSELLQKRNMLRQEEITEEIEVIMLSVESFE
ncbi:MAG TPA: FoF1 ATP synthase subunit gamma [Candidatus Binatia bacterium]